MKQNMGYVDRALRVVAAVAIGVLYSTGQVDGTFAIVLGVIAVVLLISALLGFCPLYLPLKLSTLKKKDA